VARKTGTLFCAPELHHNLFHYLHQEDICNNAVTEDSTTPKVSLHYLVKFHCLKSNNWKQNDLYRHIFRNCVPYIMGHPVYSQLLCSHLEL